MQKILKNIDLKNNIFMFIFLCLFFFVFTLFFQNNQTQNYVPNESLASTIQQSNADSEPIALFNINNNLLHNCVNRQNNPNVKHVRQLLNFNLLAFVCLLILAIFINAKKVIKLSNKLSSFHIIFLTTSLPCRAGPCVS